MIPGLMAANPHFLALSPEMRAALDRCLTPDALSDTLAAASSHDLLRCVALLLRPAVPWDTAHAAAVLQGGASQALILTLDTLDNEVTDFTQGIGGEAGPTDLFRRSLADGGFLVRSLEEYAAYHVSSFGHEERVSQSGVYTSICIDGVPIAVMSVHSYSPATFTEDHLSAVRAVLDFFAPTLARSRRLEERIRELELLRRTMDMMRAVTYERDYDTGAWQSFGHHMPELLGWPGEEITRDLWKRCVKETILLHEKPTVTLAEALHRARIGVTSEWRSELRIATASGEERWLSDSAVSVFDRYGKPKGSVGILQDITQSKRAARLRDLIVEISPHLAAALTVRDISRIMLQALRSYIGWDTCFVAILVGDPPMYRMGYLVDVDTEGVEREFLETYDKLFEPGELTRRIIREPLLINREPEIADMELPRVGGVHRRSEALLFAPMLVNGTRPIGVVSVQRYRSIPYRSDDLETLRFIAAHCAEAVGRALAEEERRRMEERLHSSEKLESLGALAGGIAHEFNNLLSSVMGHVSLLQADTPADSPLAHSLGDIGKASGRMRDLARQMLAFAGRGEMRLMNLPAAELIQETREITRLGLPKGTLVQWEDAPAGIFVRCDPTQFKQAVLNLLINAAEATPGTRASIRVRLGTRDLVTTDLLDPAGIGGLEPGSYLVVEVSDQGPGLTPEARARLFEPFRAPTSTGRGLGLAAVLGIMRSHKGAIEVDSAPGNGTRIRLYFPLVAPVSTSPGAPPPPPVGAPPRILIVDDEPSVLDVVTRMIQRLGYRVVPATSGETALEVFRGAPSRIQGALIDIMMPGMDGGKLLEELLAIRPDLPVVLMSGYTSSDVMDQARLDRTRGFLQKPFESQALAKALQESVGAV